jgi:primosomal protein N' (replication factor Y)
VEHDFHSYYREEIASRKDVRYPPFVRIALIECSGLDEQRVTAKASAIADVIRSQPGSEAVEILGPAEPAIPKLRNQYRQHILIKNDREKDPSASILRSILSPIVEAKQSSGSASGDVKVSVDIDPQSFL